MKSYETEFETCILKLILEFLRELILSGTYFDKISLLSLTLDKLVSKRQTLPKYLENSNCFPALFAYYMAQGKICGRQPLKNLK